MNQIRKKIYAVKGMHCASCEVLIEKKLLELTNIKSVQASVTKNTILIEYEGETPKLEGLNVLLKENNYTVSDFDAFSEKKFGEKTKKESFTVIILSLLMILGFLGLNKLGLSQLINVGTSTPLPIFFAFGVIAGISSCAALVGSLVLALTKQWGGLYPNSSSTRQKLQPLLLFNLGRIISYSLLGAGLGIIGDKLSVSLKFGPIFVIVVSLAMTILALQMYGLRWFKKIHLSFPQSFIRFISNESNFKGRFLPLILGALTFFLPCGFTLTAQGLALISGGATQGGLIMFLFVLGTTPSLLLIGWSGIKLTNQPYWSKKFTKIASILILFFAFYNINAQLNVLGLPSLSDISSPTDKSLIDSGQGQEKINKTNLPPIINEKQVIKMTASSAGYTPNYFQVRAGFPVRWEIKDTGTSGCTNAIISKGLFTGEILLTPGQTSVREFTPSKPGRYKFSCWMGMISGIIEVVGN
ncbi:MAG TPA: sulfite exporter TauE/SafE family protein [Patescibacteria group bacterium]|nr:sulfite exporter TauE/SafE family protein [Patescibacteria group bacterium]